MTIPDLPPAVVLRAMPTLQSAAAASASAFTGSVQVQDWGGAWWEFDIEVKADRGPAARRLGAFLVGLRGVVGRFLFAVPQRPVGLVGSPTVNGGGQTGATLATSGWSAGATMQCGDFVSIGSGADTRLHQLAADVVADGSGHAVLQLQPPLRSAPAHAAPVEVGAPKVVLRATAPIPYDPMPAGALRITFSAREAL